MSKKQILLAITMVACVNTNGLAMISPVPVADAAVPYISDSALEILSSYAFYIQNTKKIKEGELVSTDMNPCHVLKRESSERERGYILDVVGSIPRGATVVLDRDAIFCAYKSAKYGNVDVVIKDGCSCADLNFADLMYLMHKQNKEANK